MSPRAVDTAPRASRSGGAAPRRAARAGRGHGPSSVSSTSAARFAARARRRRWRRAVGVGLALLALLAAGLGAFWSPWARVERITVTGTSRVPRAEVFAAAGSQLGEPLLVADTAAVARRVRALRLVAAVQVSRRWPSTLVVTVTERQPVAAVPSAAGVDLVDSDGVVVTTARTAPAQLPLVQVDLAGRGPQALRAALQVRAQLPADLQGRLRGLGAGTVDSVWFTLADGSRVLWGSADDPQTKVAALRALLAAPPPAGARAGHRPEYDVSAPQDPAVRLG